MWWANGGNLSIAQARDTLSRGRIGPLFSPAFDRNIDHLQLIGAALKNFKMKKDL